MTGVAFWYDDKKLKLFYVIMTTMLIDAGGGQGPEFGANLVTR